MSVRDWKNRFSEKGLGIGTFPFQDYVWSHHLFFVTKNRKKGKKIHKIHAWIIQPLINLNELQFNKMKYTWSYFLDYNLVKKLQSFVSYITI